MATKVKNIAILGAGLVGVDALAGLLRVYNQMSKDTELDDLIERLDRLENEVTEDKE